MNASVSDSDATQKYPPWLQLRGNVAFPTAPPFGLFSRPIVSGTKSSVISMEVRESFGNGLADCPAFDLPGEFSITEVETAFVPQDLDGARAPFQHRADRLLGIHRKWARLQSSQAALAKKWKWRWK
jgi:hypothetical protein